MPMTIRLAQSRVHFIGVGGIGMCGLAELLHNMGAYVSGSDHSENLQTQRLASLGVQIYRGHDASFLDGAEVVVYSSAVREDNPEYQEALRRKIPLIRRAEALAEIMRLKRGIAIAGTHGKTTTTSLTASIFLGSGLRPTIVVGGRLDAIKSTAALGEGEWLIAEADESDGSFSRLSPEVVVITNIDNDHLDHYGTFANLQAAFFDFASRIPFYGVAIVCGDDPKVREVFRGFPKRIVFYGRGEDNDVQVTPEGNSWAMSEKGERIAVFKSPLPGEHNALNAAAALLVARLAGVEPSAGARVVEEFRGVDRRSQLKGRIRGIDVYDDYGHHPTEVKATLAGFKSRFPGRRLVVVFQPHRYSRTKICWEQFLTCFSDADRVFILDIYAAGEKPMDGITSQRLVQNLKHQNADFLSREENPNLEAVSQEIKAGDVLLTLGAGDVVKFGERYMDKLAKS